MLILDNEKEVFPLLPFSAVVIDETGEILEVNHAWREHGIQTNASDDLTVGVGINYLDVCDRSSGEFATFAQLAAAGIRSVIAKEDDLFELEYACHNPTERLWALMQVFQIPQLYNQFGILHIPITSTRKRMEAVIQEQKLSSLGLLAGGLAHDINNLLQVVFGQLSVYEAEHGANDTTGDKLEDTHKALQSIQSLAAQMLVYGGRSNSLPSRRELIEINAVITSNLPLLESPTKPMNCKLLVNLSVEPTWVLGTEDGFVRVILNLVTNAADAVKGVVGSHIVLSTERTVIDVHNPVVDIYTQSALAEGEYVVVTVEDNSTGIPESTLKSIFDPYFTTKTGSRGFGLSIVMGVVRSFEGAIQVNSKLTKGTKFSVYLPCSDWSADSPISKRNGVISKSVDSEVVLIIDDNLDVAKSLHSLLKSINVESIFITSGGDIDEAKDAFTASEKQPTIALLDLVIPGEDPQEIFCDLRAIYPDVGVILMSGYNKTNLAQQIISESDRTCFLAKPFRLDEIVDAILSVSSESEI